MLNLNDCCGCQLDQATVEASAVRVRELIELFRRPVREVIALHLTLYLTLYPHLTLYLALTLTLALALTSPSP